MKCSKCEYESSNAANFIILDTELICFICSVYESSIHIEDKFDYSIATSDAIEHFSSNQIENKCNHSVRINKKTNPQKELLSKSEKKWLQNKPEYSWASQEMRERMDDIVFFSHRNKFQCNFMGTIAKIISIADEWYFDYTDKIFHLKHLNNKGKRCDVHSQKNFSIIRELLQYIKRHDASVYRYKVSHIERLLEIVIPRSTESLSD